MNDIIKLTNFALCNDHVAKIDVRFEIDKLLSSCEFNDIMKLTNLALSVTKNDIPNEIN